MVMGFSTVEIFFHFCFRFQVSDTVGFTFKAHGIEFSLTVRIGENNVNKSVVLPHDKFNIILLNNR